MEKLTVPAVSPKSALRLRAYGDLLLKWNKVINLIGRSTVEAIDSRHINDSLMLTSVMTMTGRWLDIGSGAGFPGIPIAIHSNGSLKMTLVESDSRKCEFLRAVKRKLELDIDVRNERIEDMTCADANVIVSRATMGLPVLINYADRHGSDGAACLFPTGEGWRDQLEAATIGWQFDAIPYESATDPNSVVLKVTDWSRR